MNGGSAELGRRSEREQPRLDKGIRDRAGKGALLLGDVGVFVGDHARRARRGGADRCAVPAATGVRRELDVMPLTIAIARFPVRFQRIAGTRPWRRRTGKRVETPSADDRCPNTIKGSTMSPQPARAVVLGMALVRHRRARGVRQQRGEQRPHRTGADQHCACPRSGPGGDDHGQHVHGSVVTLGRPDHHPVAQPGSGTPPAPAAAARRRRQRRSGAGRGEDRQPRCTARPWPRWPAVPTPSLPATTNRSPSTCSPARTWRSASSPIPTASATSPRGWSRCSPCRYARSRRSHRPPSPPPSSATSSSTCPRRSMATGRCR